jgi:hypothetical protein
VFRGEFSTPLPTNPRLDNPRIGNHRFGPHQRVSFLTAWYFNGVFPLRNVALKLIIITNNEKEVLRKEVDVAYYTILCYGYEGVTSSNNGVHRYVIIRNSLDSIFNILPVLIRRWEIQTCLQMTFLPYYCLHKVWRKLVYSVDGLQNALLCPDCMLLVQCLLGFSCFIVLPEDSGDR